MSGISRLMTQVLRELLTHKEVGFECQDNVKETEIHYKKCSLHLRSIWCNNQVNQTRLTKVLCVCVNWICKSCMCEKLSFLGIRRTRKKRGSNNYCRTFRSWLLNGCKGFFRETLIHFDKIHWFILTKRIN